MAIIKCDDVGIDAIISTGSFEGAVVTTEEYVEQNKVSLGKTLLAVESGFFLSDTLSPVISKANVNLLETRPPDVADTFRADSNRYWTLDENGNMKYMNTNIYGFVANENSDSPPPTFMLWYGAETLIESTPLGLDCVEVEYTIIANAGDDVFDTALWKAFVDGAEGEGGSSYIDRDGNSFTRPTSLIPTGQTFTDHAFTMNTPFSKKELEMFANISDTVKFDVADVESDYDFFAKAYEEGIAPTNVPENALPHLYTEVQRGESEAENTIVSTTTLAGDQVEEGFFREWINTTLPNQSFMDSLIEPFENVAILDSVVDEDSILDSENKTTSAFEILMAYANRENLFPMNVNIEVGTNEASDVMFEAEEVGMVDDIVKMLMGDGDVTDSTPPEDEYDYGDWNWEDMNQLGKDLAEQGNVDYSLKEEEEKEYDWSTASIVTYYFGRNYDQANSGNWAKQAEKYEDGSFLISEAAELWRVFQKEMNKKKDFYRANWGSSFSDDELDKFFQHVFTDIDAFVEAHDRKNNDATYPSEKMRYNSLHWDPNASHNRQLPDDNHDDTEVYVTVLDDGEGKVTIKVKFWKEV